MPAAAVTVRRRYARPARPPSARTTGALTGKPVRWPRPAGREALEEADVLGQVARGEELVAHALARPGAEPGGGASSSSSRATPRRTPRGRADRRRAARSRRRRSGPGCRRSARRRPAVAFHIASATVSPKPSARLFWTTTVGVALERVDDRGVLLEGRPSAARRGARGRARRRAALARRADAALEAPAAPSGSSATASTSGPASTRWASAWPAATCATKPSMTPIGSLSASQRETCVPRGRRPASGASSTICARRSTRPGRAVRRG